MTGLREVDRSGVTGDGGVARMTVLRRCAVTAWALVVTTPAITRTLTFDLGPVMAVVITGLVAASVGRRNPLLVLRD